MHANTSDVLKDLCVSLSDQDATPAFRSLFSGVVTSQVNAILGRPFKKRIDCETNNCVCHLTSINKI